MDRNRRRETEKRSAQQPGGPPSQGQYLPKTQANPLAVRRPRIHHGDSVLLELRTHRQEDCTNEGNRYAKGLHRRQGDRFDAHLSRLSTRVMRGHPIGQ